ncbi:MAG: hypothetical protein FWD47_15785 [Treponema sp.]|nr:hypothetical protein [Treponema sp.]
MRRLKLLSVVFMLFLFIVGCKENIYNLDFEKISNSRPVGWEEGIGGPDEEVDNPNYTIYLDSAISKKGNYSAVIEYKEGIQSFHSWVFKTL